jgi:hypothetical protein
MPKKGGPDKLTELLANFDESLLGDEFPRAFDDASPRVERILLDLVRPDPVQPRRVLPERIYNEFHASRMTPSQALRELVQIAQLAARQQGRPFSAVLELLGNPDDESDTEPPALSPEEALVRDLVNLAVTIRDDGQVNPLTVVDVTQGVTRQYRIETGERRYWATWLLRDFIPAYEGDGMIPCVVIPAEQSSPFRQAKENTARTGLSAVAMARQAALLLLFIHGHDIPDGAVPNDFYRQALELDLRGKREYTDAVLAAMGGIKKTYFSAIKSVLRLSDEALELADRCNLEVTKLRYVISLPAEYHYEIVRQIVDFGLTSKQVKELCRTDVEDEKANDLAAMASPSAIRMARAVKTINTTSPQDLVQALIHQEGDVDMAIARLRATRRLLDEAENLLAES